MLPYVGDMFNDAYPKTFAACNFMTTDGFLTSSLGASTFIAGIPT